MKICVDMGFFKALKAHQAQTTDQLATCCNSDATLVARLSRELTANGVIKEISNKGYISTPFSAALASDDGSSTISLLMELCMPCYVRTPNYFRENDFKNPAGLVNCPWLSSMDTKMTFFEWLAKHPQHLKNFGASTAAFNRSLPYWTEIYPVEDLFPTSPDLPPNRNQTPFLVDVGGGPGHDLERFRALYPDPPGLLYLQDLPEVIQGAKVHESVIAMPYDFFTPQPIHGARVYFTRNVLHNWPDDQAKKILMNLRPAVRPAYSKVLLHENMIADSQSSALSTSVDLMMMTLCGSSSRSESHWRRLCLSAGFEVIKIWHHHAGLQPIMELEMIE